MTWNFALLAIDQVVNAAAKMLYMSGGQFPMPMVFRGPNGSALQLSAQHSQAWESWLAHIPGLKVITPGTPADAKGLLKSAIRDDNPVVFLEGEMLYNTKGEVPDGEYTIPIGKAELKREGDACTIVTHGKMVLVAMQAADTLAKLQAHLAKQGFGDLAVNMSGGYDPTQTDPGSRLIKAQLSLYRKLGLDPLLWPRGAGSWPGFVFTAAPLSLPAGHFGLGHGTGAHAPDEYYLIESNTTKVAGLREVQMGFVEFLYELGSMRS